MSFFTSIFSNAVSFISSFFTKEDEEEFDNLYLEKEENGVVKGVGELATLVPVPEVISPVPEVILPAVPPAPAGLVGVPEAEPTGIVIVQPAAVAPVAPDATEPVNTDLLEVHKMSELIPVYTNKKNNNKVYNITQIDLDDKFDLMTSNERSQITKNKNRYYKDISKIDFCIEIVNPEDPATYDYILDTSDDNTKLGFINLKMYNTKNLPTPFTENSVIVDYATITKSSININDSELVNKIGDALKIVDNSINEKHKVSNIPGDDLKTIFLGKSPPLYSTPGTKYETNYEKYFNLYMKQSNNVISPNVNLVMSYSYDPLNTPPDNYKINFSYVIAPVKTQKKSLLNQEMVDIISNKLTNSTDCVKDLFNNFGSGTEYNLNGETNPSYQAVITIYDSANINTTKLQELRSKPYTLLKPSALNTYLNILISMLDKPHDIIGNRVAEEVQKYMLNSVIAPNIIAYINYLKQVLSSNIISGKKDEFNKFIEFVEDMVFTFTNNTSKYVNTETTYENAIMLFVCKILETDDNITTNNHFLPELKTKFPISDTTNVVINPDIMYLTTDITDRVNQTNDKFRKYFSAPEIIDHGHVYNINNNTNIQFPENYKEIQVKDISNTNYFTIHSYSETKNITDTDINKLYYNVYVWFTEGTDDVPKCLIKYTIPFMNAPDCAGVYAGYKNMKNYDNIKQKFTNYALGFNSLSAEMKKLIPFLMLDQFYNAKSLQDDQNQLQVNQTTTIPPIPPINADSVPTQFLGLCCDLASAANGLNYYMSRQKLSVPPNPNLQNPNSIVGYYHAKKKIWITNNNQIKFEVNAAKKDASKDIFDVLNDVTPTSVTLGGTKNKVQQNGGTDDDNYEIEEYGEYGEYGEYMYYNTMADWLYDDNNFKNKKYDLNKLFKRVKYDVYGKEYISSNCYFDIFSNDFVKKMIEMLKIYSDRKRIKNSENLKDIIKKCAIYILTKFKLTPDNIYTPNEQIRLSNVLDQQWKNLITLSKSQNRSIQSIPQTPKKIQKRSTYMDIEMGVEQNDSKRRYSEPQTPKKPSDIARGAPQNLKRRLEFNKENNPPNKKTLKIFGGFTKKINKKKANKKKTNKKRIKRMVRKTRRKH